MARDAAAAFCARCIRLCVEARQAEEAYVASVQVCLVGCLVGFPSFHAGAGFSDAV